MYPWQRPARRYNHLSGCSCEDDQVMSFDRHHRRPGDTQPSRIVQCPLCQCSEYTCYHRGTHKNILRVHFPQSLISMGKSSWQACHICQREEQDVRAALSQPGMNLGRKNRQGHRMAIMLSQAGGLSVFNSQDHKAEVRPQEVHQHNGPGQKENLFLFLIPSYLPCISCLCCTCYCCFTVDSTFLISWFWTSK
jgi:hypothetical protein